jgi:hypothetical protein
MKNLKFLTIILLLIFISGCKTNYKVGAELTSPNQLKIKKGFTAYMVTTRNNGKILLIESNSPGARQTQTAWKCSCGKDGGSGECKIETTEGSDTAECRGGCFCGFKKTPVPTSLQIKSRTLIVAVLN